jgi:hypothetical protein
VSVNILTAFNIVRHLQKRNGSTFKRDVLQVLNRQDNVEETLNGMATLGMVSVAGDGKHGNPKTVQLAERGGEFANSFEHGTLFFAYLVPGELWKQFRERAEADGQNPALALDIAMREYIKSVEKPNSNPFK